MFGKDLEGYLENEIVFAHQGTRPNQDVYYNWKEDKLWCHKYCGNESLSPGTYEDNILLVSVKNYEDLSLSCTTCNYEKKGTECKEWDCCQANSLYEYIKDNKEDEISKEIQEKMLNDCHVDEFNELKLLLEEVYGEYHEYLNLVYNQSWKMNIVDNIVDQIVENGIEAGTNVNDGWLDADCQQLYYRFCEYSENPQMIKLGKLLQENKIVEALELIK